MAIESSANLTSPPDHTRKKSNSIASEDFETALRKAGFGRFNYFMLLIAIPASATAAFASGTMSFVIPVAEHDLGLTPMSKALLQSSTYAGMIFSAFFWGVLSDSFGRQRLLAAGFLLDFVMNTACALIPYMPSIIVFKFLSGFMVCGPFSIFMAYISELFVDKRRDMAVLSIGIFSSIGQLLHVCVALLMIPAEPPVWLPLKSWQLFILFCGIPSLLAGTACAFCVESPKFLAEKGKPEKALDVCKTIYTINTGLAPDTYTVKKIHEANKISESSKAKPAMKKILDATSVLRPPFVSRLLMVFAMQAFIVTTMNMIRLWLPEMLTVMANADPKTASQTTYLCPLLVAGHEAQGYSSKIVSKNHIYYNMMAVYGSSFIAQLLFALIVKYVGKKCITIAAASIAFCCTLTISNIHSGYIFIPAAIAISVLDCSFFSQAGLIVEIFPTHVRATSVSMTMMVGRIAVLTGNFLIANLMYTYCEYIFYCLAAFCLCVIILGALLDTKPFSPISEGEITFQA